MSTELQAFIDRSSIPFETTDETTGACGLRIHDLTHRYTNSAVLQNLNLHLPAGEYACLLGDSGSGKSTLLRLVAGIEHSQSGRIEIAGRIVADSSSGLHVVSENRDLGMVFQDQALWPHLSVQAHLEFPLKARRRTIDHDNIKDLLHRLGLHGLEQRRPDALSGGQRQRVGLARALASNPRLLLLDEPLSAVDTAMRTELRRYLKRLFDELGFTALHVTHDPDEAFELATRVGVLERGRLQQWDTPARVYRNPATLNVGRLSGICGVVEVDCIENHRDIAQIRWQEQVYRVPSHPDVRPGAALLFLRPDALKASDQGLNAHIIDARFQGDRWLIQTRIGHSSHLPLYLRAVPSQSLRVQLIESAAWILPIA